jgi:hypothetical protein
MIHPNGHDPGTSVVLEEPETAIPDTGERAPAAPGAALPFATRSKVRPRQQLAQNKIVLIAGGAVVVVLLLFVFSSAPAHKSVALKGKQGALGHQAASHQSEAGQADENPEEQRSLFPVIESGKPPAKDTLNGLIGEQDVEHTATRQPRTIKGFQEPRVAQNGTLGAIPLSDGEAAWQPPPYQPGSNSGAANAEVPKAERTQASLVFVQKVTPSSTTNAVERMVVDPASSLGLPTGTRLRARLESTASTAIKAPVSAVIEYNYEKNGEIVIPAGTKAFGRIEQADRSGYMSIKFDSLLMPDGS